MVGRRRRHQDTLFHARRDLVNVTRHQLQFGVAVRGATGVGQCDPAGDVELVFGGVELHHVVCLPGQAAGKVAQFHILLRSTGVVKRHDQRGAVTQVGRHIAIDNAPGNAGLNARTDLQHHAVIR